MKEVIERKLLGVTIRVTIEPVGDGLVRIIDYQRRRDNGERWMRVKHMCGKRVHLHQIRGKA